MGRPRGAAAEKLAQLAAVAADIRSGRVAVRGVEPQDAADRLEARMERIRATGRVVP